MFQVSLYQYCCPKFSCRAYSIGLFQNAPWAKLSWYVMVLKVGLCVGQTKLGEVLDAGLHSCASLVNSGSGR